MNARIAVATAVIAILAFSGSVGFAQSPAESPATPSSQPGIQSAEVAKPRAAVVSVRAPDRSEMGPGWQWFSVGGIDGRNRPARVDAALPEFVRTVSALQQVLGTTAERATLIV